MIRSGAVQRGAMAERPRRARAGSARSLIAFGLACVLCLLGVAGAARAAPRPEGAAERVARIGVLAFRGPERARRRWAPLARYLADKVPGWTFEVVPVTLVSAGEHLAASELDFLITNPGHYVTLAERFGLSALATRERRQGTAASGLMRYGSVIFVRADREDIRTIADLRGKTLAAVSPEAFGGFQVAWYEFRKQGLDPFTDLAALQFKGFPQDEIVFAVRDGRADAGVIRSGLLELMAREGRARVEDFRVLQANLHVVYPHRVSTRLYPEWPFAARAGIDRRLAERVAMALLGTQDKSTAARYGLKDLWSVPLAYDGVRRMVRSLSTSVSAVQGEGAAGGGLTAAMQSLIAVAVALTTAAVLAAYYAGMRRAGRGAGVVQAQLQAAAAGGASGRETSGDAALEERFSTLTKRERQVLVLLCKGEPTKRIADMLGISPKTVEYHRANLLHKTGARTTPHMVQLATRAGFDR